jgi:hypothetical protein
MELDKITEIQNWYYSGILTELIVDNICETRSSFNGRLASYESLLKREFSEDCLYLVSSSLGEIGNNCFDHNLGFWQGDAGCLFVRDQKFALICDRGRGIKESLSLVYSLAQDDIDYISVAFSKIISGRAPEKRGNGLKFVKKNILSCNLGILCVSGHDFFHLGKPMDDCCRQLISSKSANNGVLTYVYW